MGKRVHEDSISLLPYSEEIVKRGLIPSSKVLELKILDTILKIQNLLKLNKMDKIIKLKRVRYANDDPIAIHDSYLPYTMCKEVYDEDYNWEKQSMTQVLDNLNLFIVRANQRVYTASADQGQASLLKIHKGDPLLIIERICYLSNNMPIKYAEIVNRGDIWDFAMNLKRRNIDLNNNI